ncbi:protein kinase domain-containing protein [Verticillium dahliae VdLs.17]|uniref:non-specific serine/threonine protein kinase n=1 Tax=Verticillium dahliae (strain VdLs.17 / ATCC MYA-4575 / FGSC 10137) TaxID=498257 RepID=G2XJ07_VERDV|nr:protein kinase domain-containing protein [Verticillium dahliae VdLs.17]EGY20510.1 protein kinase domain-containing protein [Verticillium dahliae VdLs.17]KAH6696307.1 kinase domain-containing protein [Verticillium dahliae]
MGRIAIANRAADVRKTLEDSRKKRGAICVGSSCLQSHSSTKSASPVEYGYVQGVEHLSDYRPGGYHPIYINDRLDKRYRIVHKLGHGTFSTAWLAIDEKASRYVAIKVGTADAKHAEFDILSQLTQSVTSCSDTEDELSQIPIVLDRFDLSGPNGTHSCLVALPARCSLRDAREASGSSLFQLDVARSLAAQLVLAVSLVHSQGYAHEWIKVA